MRPLSPSLSPRSGLAGWGRSPGEGQSRSQARAPPAGTDPAQGWDSKDKDTQLDQDTQTYLDPQHQTLGNRDTGTQKFTHADTDPQSET